MKKQIKILILVMALVLTSISSVNAADAIATLRLSSTEVEKGGTFTVILNVACEEGINGLITTASYDETKLELTKSEIIDTSRWINLGENLKFEIIHNSSDTQTSVDMVKLTFNIKDSAESGTKAKVTFSDIVLDSDAGTNSTKQIGTKEIEVSVKEKQTSGQPGENPTDKESDTNKNNNTESENKIPNTGMTSNISAISIIAVLSFIFLIKYNNYKEI